jgi:hypothetical protein
MEMKTIVIICLALFACSIDAHPHPYPQARAAVKNWLPHELPPILSYHIHCVFQNGDKTIVKEALELRTRFENRFNLNNTEECRTLYKNDRLCMFDTEMVPSRGSPFVSGNWAAFIPLENFLESKF